MPPAACSDLASGSQVESRGLENRKTSLCFLSGSTASRSPVCVDREKLRKSQASDGPMKALDVMKAVLAPHALQRHGAHCRETVAVVLGTEQISTKLPSSRWGRLEFPRLPLP